MIHGICLKHTETCLAIHVLHGILHSTNPSATGASPVQVSTGRLVARFEQRIRSTTPMPMTARRPSTMNSFSPLEIPPNSLAGQQRPQISELQFDKFTTPSSFMYWKIRFKTQVSSCCDFPRRQRHGSKKWRWPIQWKNENPCDQ